MAKQKKNSKGELLDEFIRDENQSKDKPVRQNSDNSCSPIIEINGNSDSNSRRSRTPHLREVHHTAFWCLSFFILLLVFINNMLLAFIVSRCQHAFYSPNTWTLFGNSTLPIELIQMSPQPFFRLNYCKNNDYYGSLKRISYDNGKMYEGCVQNHVRRRNTEVILGHQTSKTCYKRKCRI